MDGASPSGISSPVRRARPARPANGARTSRRSTPEHARHGEGSADGDVRARAGVTCAKRDRAASRHTAGPRRPHRTRPDFHVELGARDRDRALALESESWPDQRHLEHRGRVRVADETVGKPRRPPVHRARHRDAPSSEPPSSAVLNRREHAGPFDDEAHRVASAVLAASDSKRLAGTGTNRTRSPGDSRPGGVARRVEQRHRRAANHVPAAGTVRAGKCRSERRRSPRIRVARPDAARRVAAGSVVNRGRRGTGTPEGTRP